MLKEFGYKLFRSHCCIYRYHCSISKKPHVFIWINIETRSVHRCFRYSISNIMNFACIDTIKSYSWSKLYHVSPVFVFIQKLEGSLSILLGPKFILATIFKNILKVFFIIFYDGLPIFTNSLASENLFYWKMFKNEKR